jgi:hypothetical protein
LYQYHNTAVTTADPLHGNFILSTSNWTNFGDALWQSGLNDPCPTGYRMPTEAELNGERGNFSTNNAAGAFNSPLKLSVAGYRSRNSGSIFLAGTTGLYWSSTVGTASARYLHFQGNNAYMNANHRTLGCFDIKT